MNGRCERKVRGLYPVAIPRLSHDETRDCSGHAKCRDRVGAWSHEETHCDLLRPRATSAIRTDTRPAWKTGRSARRAGSSAGYAARRTDRCEPNADRIDAIAGHVRFTHGLLRGRLGPSPASPQARLGHPADPGLAQADDHGVLPEAQAAPGISRPAREDAMAAHPPEDSGSALPIDRGLPARPEVLSAAGGDHTGGVHDLGAGGLTRPPDDKNRQPGTRDSQNQTVHLLPGGHAVRLPGLLRQPAGRGAGGLALRADAPRPARLDPSVACRGRSGRHSQSPGPALWHLLGHGKPLGMGRCSIAVERLHLDSFHPADPGHRYARVPDFQRLPALTAPGEPGRSEQGPGRPQSVPDRTSTASTRPGSARAGERRRPGRRFALRLVEMLRVDGR